MKVTVSKGQGNQAAFASIQGADNVTRQGIRRALQRLRYKLIKEASAAILNPQKNGKLYRLPGGRRHRASAPLQAPANRTGRLLRSVAAVMRGSQQLEFGYLDSADYGGFLESGTRNMAPRPNLVFRVNQNNRTLQSYLQQEAAKRR